MSPVEKPTQAEATGAVDPTVEAVARLLIEQRGVNPNTLYQHDAWQDIFVDEHVDYDDPFTGEPRVRLMHRAWRKRIPDAEAILALVSRLAADQAARTTTTEGECPLPAQVQQVVDDVVAWMKDNPDAGRPAFGKITSATPAYASPEVREQIASIINKDAMKSLGAMRAEWADWVASTHFGDGPNQPDRAKLIERMAQEEWDELQPKRTKALAKADRILATLATPPATPAGGGDRLGYDRMGSYGRCDWTHLNEAVAEATTGARSNAQAFDPKFRPGHQMVKGINFNSLSRIVTAFVDAALSPSPDAAPAREASHG